MPRSAGFDCGSYPGDNAVKEWAANSPYGFVGFYLDAPCHSPVRFTTWSGKFPFITQQGLGLAVIYVGHQQDGCGKNSLSRQKGLDHGADTIAKCTVEGFPAGTIVFLDVEFFNGPLSANMEGYIRGWISALLDSAGALSAGIYCPKKSANDIHLAASREYAAHGLPDGAPAFWIVKTRDPLFDPSTSNPVDCGVPFANVWQGRIDVNGEVHGSVAIDIDQNVADSKDPSRVLTRIITT